MSGAYTNKTIRKKTIRKTFIVHDPPVRTDIYNIGAPYRVLVTSEEDEQGRGCVHCGRCVTACTHNLERADLPAGVFWMEEIEVDKDGNKFRYLENAEEILIDKILHIVQEECCNCKRCVKECPQRAIQVFNNPEYWDFGCTLSDANVINGALKRSQGVEVVSSAHWGTIESKLKDNWLIDAAEILSPQRDNRYEYAGDLKHSFLGKRTARYPVNIPIFDTNQSYGSNSHEAFLSRLIASIKLGRPFFTGEGYIHPDMASAYKYCIIQFGSGGYGPWVDVDKFAGFCMKYGQDAKKGKGGRLPAPKNDLEIALIRCVEALRVLTAPNPQHLQYSIEELPMRVETLRALFGDEKLIGADAYGTAWNYPQIVVALARAGFDYITIKAGDGSTGAAHEVDLMNRGLNVVYLTHIADSALRKEGLRESVSLIAEGGVRDGFGAFLVLLAGADFVGMGMPQLHPLGCTLCKRCHTGQCAWGITSRKYGIRIDPLEGANRIVKMNQTWANEMEGFAAGLGMSNITDVVGSRRFRYHGPDPLLFETFGKKEWGGQHTNVNLRSRQHKIFKPAKGVFEENKTLIESALKNIKKDKLTIDVGIDRITTKVLNLIMKEAVREGVEIFNLRNVCGQRYIGTGVKAKEIHVHGLSGNNAYAFVRDVKIFTYPEKSNGIHLPGNGQVGIANCANPLEINISGEVNDLFAAYAVSGTFRVAKSGGVRNLLLFKAGIPDIWKKIDHDYFQGLDDEEAVEDLLLHYQDRRGKIMQIGWDAYIKTFEGKLKNRVPPVAVFGLDKNKGMGDYFMEYAQGGIGILLNIFNLKNPVGYYACSGLSAGAAYIRGKIDKSQLGVGVKIVDEIKYEKEKEFLAKQIKGFIKTFLPVHIDDDYDLALKNFAESYNKDKHRILSGFCKIVSVDAKDEFLSENIVD